MGGIIPTYSLSSPKNNNSFLVNRPVNEKDTLLDYAIFTCAIVQCNFIVMICLPEQIPYLKLRYGDIYLSSALVPRNIKEELDYKIHPLKIIPIYYISVSEIYRDKYDTDYFNIFWAAKILNKTFDETLGVGRVWKFFFCFPSVVIAPHYFLHENEKFMNLLKGTIWNFKKSNENIYHFATKWPELIAEPYDWKKYPLPKYSHIFLSGQYADRVWNFIKKKYVETRKTGKINTWEIDINIENILNKLVLNPKNKSIVIDKQYLFDVSKWDEYVKLLNFVQEQDKNPEILMNHFNYDKYVKNMGKLDYHFRGSMIDYTDYYVKRPRKKKNREYRYWTKLREQLRKQNKA